MELLNATKMQAGYTLGMDPDGRERLVVAVKGTFVIPEDDQEPELAEEQVPLVMADEYAGEPGQSSVLYESDFAPYKPRCDVLLNGSAYAPNGTPVTRVRVDLEVGNMSKTFEVWGHRFWVRGLLGVSASKPKPFMKTPISYDHAYGGTDVHPDKPAKAKAYMDNPVGAGYHPCTPAKVLEGTPLPNSAEAKKPVKSVTGRYRPMSFGSIGRNFTSRLEFAGTYDQHWQDEVFPFLPADFDPLYFQSAPRDQQIDYPKGNERVNLVNLTPTGRTSFPLPGMQVPVEFFTVDYERTEVDAVLDTVLIEPDHERLMLTWRASAPLKRNIFEMAQVVVGRMTPAWYRARETGKTHYPSLRHAVRGSMGGEEESEE